MTPGDPGTEKRGTARRWVVRLILAVLLLEAAWLLGINLALRAGATQAWLNSLRPDKVNLAWASAWSWIPGRVEVRGAVVSGQTWRLQWQAEADRVQARVALLPLFRRRVEISAGEVANGRYFQRPRLEPGMDYSDALPFYPDIRGFPVAEVGEPPTYLNPPWQVSIADARLSGPQSVWIGRLQAQLEARADVRLETRSQGGPLDLHVEPLEFDIHRAWADAGRDILSGGELRGTVHLGPYRWREHRGLQSVRFLDLDLEVVLESDSLDFVRLFLHKYPALEADGHGAASGRLVVRDGVVAADTQLHVNAGDLVVALPPFAVQGHGVVRLEGTDRAELPFTMNFAFADLDVLHYDDRSAFLAGQGLQVRLEGDGDLVPRLAAATGEQAPFRAAVEVAEAALDVRAFNRYLPPNSPLTFTGGDAAFTAGLMLTEKSAGGDFQLQGDAVRVRLDEQDLGLDLRLDGLVSGGTPPRRRFDLGGSVLTLDRAWVQGEEERFDEVDWRARADMHSLDLALGQPVVVDLEADLAVSDTRPLAALFRNNGGPDWIARRLTVDDLTGRARLSLRDERLFVPDAKLGAEELEVAMKGVVGEPFSQGLFYLRYKRLDALLRFEGGERDIILFRSRRKFDEYQAPLPAGQ